MSGVAPPLVVCVCVVLCASNSARAIFWSPGESLSKALRIRATTYLVQAHYYRGDYERAVQLATDNFAAVPPDWVHEYIGAAQPLLLYDYIFGVSSLAQLGRFDEAFRYAVDELRLDEARHHASAVGQAHYTLGILHVLRGAWREARSLIEQGIVVFRTGNVLLNSPGPVALSAWVLAQVGEATDALVRLREGEQLLERQAANGVVYQLGRGYHSLGRAALLLGALEEARILGERAIKYSPQQPGDAAHAEHLLGDIAAHPDRLDAELATLHYLKALALAEPRGMRPLVAHCHLGLGKLYQRTGQREQAQEHLTTATTMYREMGMTYWLEKAEAEVSVLG